MPAEEVEFILFYGSLRHGQPMFAQLGLGWGLEFAGPASFSGELLDLGDYCGAVAGDGSVVADAYRIVDPAILPVLDRYEEFDPAQPEASLFVRRCVEAEGFEQAWVYLYNGPDRERRIRSGDWLNRQSANRT